MTLDHSSPVTLVGDLDLHKRCVFRYDLKGGRHGPLWRLVWARTGNDDHLLICTRSTRSTALNGSGVEESSEWRLRDGYLQLMPDSGLPPYLYWQVVVDGPPLRGSSSADQLDKNLRGVFA